MKSRYSKSRIEGDLCKASYLVHWPSGVVTACEKHKEALVNLADTMGCHVGVVKLEQEELCSNCINEKKKADGEKNRD